MNETTPPLDQLRDPKEKTAWLCLAVASVPLWVLIVIWVVASMGIPLIFIGLLWLAKHLGEYFAAAFIRTNGVRLAEGQLPGLHALARQAALKLGVELPEVYVLQHNVWNAFAVKLAGKRLVVLYSGAIDSLLLKGDIRQLTWLIGHELGHHAAGHLDAGRRWVVLGGWLPWLYLWYSRRCEFTCDRVGLYCAGSLELSNAALANLAVGSQLADKVNLAEAIRQWEGHSKEFFVRYRTMYSTHPQLLCRLAELRTAAASLGIPEAAA